MNTRHCLKIAGRINALLVRELGQGIDPTRMVAEPLYARDVLLVCAAMPGTELAELAPRFRESLHAAETERETKATTGTLRSRFLSSLFGPTTGSPPSSLDTPPRRQPAEAPAAPTSERSRLARERSDNK